jgi:hypothetical protein
VRRILAEKTVETTAIEKYGQIVSSLLRTLAEPGCAAVRGKGIEIDVRQSHGRRLNRNKPAAAIQSQSTISEFFRLRAAFIGALPASG